jgi:hypothetical protein
VGGRLLPPRPHRPRARGRHDAPGGVARALRDGGTRIPADDGTQQLDPARFGLQSDYGDCGDCPRDFTISTDGESLVWTHGADLVVADTSSGSTRRWTVPSLATVPFLSSLDVRASSDGGVEALISFGLDVSSTIRPPVVVATSPPGGVVETPVSGQLATFGP